MDLVEVRRRAQPHHPVLARWPGTAQIVFSRKLQERLHSSFLVVDWDQRGAGRSYSRRLCPEDMTIERFASDAEELTVKLLDRFGRDKLFLVGHSWGSIIGAMLAAKRPDLVRAYIGIGQVVDMKRGEEVSYRFTLDEARRLTNKRAVRQLERIGPPPYAQVSDGGVQRKWLSKFHGSTYQGGLYGPLLKNLSVRDVRPLDVFGFVAGAMFSLKTLDAEQQEVNLLRDLPEIEVPVFFCTGAGTPPSRASSLPSTRRRCERPRSRSSGSSDQGTCRTSKNPRCSRRPACRSSSSRHTRVAGCKRTSEQLPHPGCRGPATARRRARCGSWGPAGFGSTSLTFMLLPYSPNPNYITTMRDGTIKQLNPFSGTEVWTVPGRGNRPLGILPLHPEPIDPAAHGHYCAFCEGGYLDTPPEKSRVIRDGNGWHTVYRTPAENLFDTVAEFRRVPNLFEILSYDYWHANYAYEIPVDIAERRRNYLASPAGRAHVLTVAKGKLRASGRTADAIAAMTEDEVIEFASGFFGGGHDVIIARRHYVDGATTNAELASSGTLTPEEHYRYMAFTVESLRRLYEINRYVPYVAVFQNWLKPAGASSDHLHKQLVSIDERGVQNELAIQRLRSNPNMYNEAAVNYASYHNLLLAENDYAVAFAGFGHRYPSIEIFSKSEHAWPWDHTADEVGGVSDLVHAMHAATGVDVPTNEEWHHRPVDVDLSMPWRILLKWRVSTLAGFEGGTKVYLNTIDPMTLRDRILPKLYALRGDGRLGDLRIGPECSGTPNVLRYNPVSR